MGERTKRMRIGAVREREREREKERRETRWSISIAADAHKYIVYTIH